jgi:hypothetical protein
MDFKENFLSVSIAMTGEIRGCYGVFKKFLKSFMVNV